MPDHLNRLQRSQNMSRIRSKGNKTTEAALLRYLRMHRITGWRRHQPLPGTPDFAFAAQRLAVFVDGCFWHNCPRCQTIPSNNHQYWREKFRRNRLRDRRANRQLHRIGWSVFRIWEHCLISPQIAGATISRLARKLRRLDTYSK
jgi:DNA mismatch endonuclease (patch repair protein)